MFVEQPQGSALCQMLGALPGRLSPSLRISSSCWETDNSLCCGLPLLPCSLLHPLCPQLLRYLTPSPSVPFTQSLGWGRTLERWTLPLPHWRSWWFWRVSPGVSCKQGLRPLDLGLQPHRQSGGPLLTDWSPGKQGTASSSRCYSEARADTSWLVSGQPLASSRVELHMFSSS